MHSISMHRAQEQVILVALLLFSSCTLQIGMTCIQNFAEKYYVTPNPSTPCPGDNVQCFTLTQYASKPTSYFACNTTLIVLPGMHYLGSEFRIVGIEHLTILANCKSNLSAVLLCNTSGKFLFKQIDQLEIIKIKFIGCVGNNVTLVRQLKINECNFFSKMNEGKVISLMKVTKAYVLRSSFIGNEYNQTDQSLKYITEHQARKKSLALFLYKTSAILISSLIQNFETMKKSAVTVWSSNFTAHNSTFINNTSSELGGAMLLIKSNITIHSSTFTNNSAAIEAGGVMYLDNSNIKIHNSTFVNNNAMQGGVINHQDSIVSINNSTFINNRASHICGVMSNIDSIVTIKNSIFTNNMALRYGGVMKSTNCNVTILDSRFESNIAEQGGVMYNKISCVNIIRSIFLNNIASELGGVMFHRNSSVLMQNSVFSKNTAMQGGVMENLDSNVSAINNVFTYNKVTQLGGVMEHWDSYVTIHNSTFNTNSAAMQGGVMNHERNKVTISNSTFTNNKAAKMGGVMFHRNSSVTITNGVFRNNEAKQGGVMENENCNVTIQDSGFTNNTAYKFGGVMAHSNIIVRYPMNNTQTVIKSDGGILVNHCLNSIIINNSTFINNIGKNGGVIIFLGGLNNNATINNSKFSKNTAVEHGGVIVYVSKFTLTQQVDTFTNLITFTRSFTLTSDNDSIIQHPETDISIKNSIFSGNIASKSGVMYHTNCNTVIRNSRFTNNVAIIFGGVMYHEKSSIAIHNSTFINNTVTQGGVINNLKSNSGLRMGNSAFKNASGEFGGVLSHHNSNITIHNSKFTNNQAKQGGVMENESCNVTIIKSIFTNNVARNIGGVSFQMNGSVTIYNSTFAKNRANSNGGVFINMNVTITIYNSTFINNTATGVTVMYQKVGNVTIYNSIFSNNRASVSGCSTFLISSSTIKTYGYLIIDNNKANLGNGIVLYVTECIAYLTGNITISNNYGTISIFSSNITFSGQTSIVKNLVHGIAPHTHQLPAILSAFQSAIIFKGIANIIHNRATIMSGNTISFTESKLYTYGFITIANNIAVNGGGIYTYQSELNFKGRSVIRQNLAYKRGGGIFAISSTIKFLPGIHQFVKNQANEGGGVCLELNAKLYLIIKLTHKSPFSLISNISIEIMNSKQNTQLEFEDNSANYGGAVYIMDDTNSGICESGNLSTDFRGECFLQVLANYDNTYDAIENFTNLRYAHFTKNSATRRGDTVYGGLLDRCTLNPSSELFYATNFPTNSITSYISTVTNIPKQDIKSVISSDPVRVCFCLNSFPDCSYYLPTLNVWKGKTFKVSVVAVDQVNNTIANTSIHSYLSPQGGLDEGQSIQPTSVSCTELEYTIISPHKSEIVTLYAEGPCKDSGISATTFKTVFNTCPIGFIDIKSKCDCDLKLFGYIADCSIETNSVLRKNNSWISYENVSHWKGYLTYPYCPFDYCYPPSKNVWINLNIPNGSDTQCALNHSGKLCGACKDGLSLSLGSSRCIECSNYWLALFIPLAIAGIALVVFLHVLNMTVVVGTINALTFYANVVFSNPTTFTPFKNSNAWTVFIAWVNLDLGFETCFYDGLDAYIKTWLQLAFPTYIILLVVLVIIASEYSQKLTRFISWRRNPVSTLATLILLSYTKILRTVIASLSFATLKYPDGSHKTVWLVDANINYFEWKHILLILVAIVILAVGLVLTSLILFWQCIQKCPNKKYIRLFTHGKLYAFMDVYLAPFNVNHHYYMGILLLARVILYIVSALTSHLNPSYTILSTISISICLLILHVFVNIFKQWPLKVLEVTFLVNITLLAASTSFVENAGGNQTTLAKVSISISIIVFVAILISHFYALVLRRVLHCLFGGRRKRTPQYQLLNLEMDADVYEASPTYTEIDACPPIEDTECDTYESTNTTNEEQSTVLTTLTSSQDIPSSRVDAHSASQLVIEHVQCHVDKQELKSLELQTIVWCNSRREEESDHEDDEVTPLLR